MLRKLLTVYENSVLFSERPDVPSEQLYLFYDQAADEWLSIPKKEISDIELHLLKTLYELVEWQSSAVSSRVNTWYEFLFLNGVLPSEKQDTSFRFIHFHLNGDDTDQKEMESALKGFFSDEAVFLWESQSKGVIIEEQKQISLSEEELLAISETLESDFYESVTFFIGKVHPFSEQLRAFFQEERELFQFALAKVHNSKIFSFERIFPAYLSARLPAEIKNMVPEAIFALFADDPEMFSTIKVFLETNLNASLTAKKLYIHRNTLQYRIDKFVEKTGIVLKDFNGAFIVFLACLLFEQKG
ncbi:helix-turn-helix domain-containing protein [Bacillus sp. FJAT-29953]|nr:helix-turn-helix domain-containing protein [Bacillus sp. FJAT-29953]